MQGADGETAALMFPASVAVVEGGAVAPNDQVWSRIVMGGAWVRVGDMRLFQLLTGEGKPAPAGEENIWPTPPLNLKGEDDSCIQ